jgi:hypothetical protein
MADAEEPNGVKWSIEKIGDGPLEEGSGMRIDLGR